MAWTNSKMFTQWALAMMGQGQTAAVLPAGFAGLGADSVKVALFNATGTPDKDAARASTGYNTGQWVTGNEVTDATNWVAGGRALASKTLTATTGTSTFDAADLSGAGVVTLSNVYGCLVYDDTITAGTGGVAKQGICFNYFGGAQSITAGTFTIVWNASGLFQVTT